MVYTIYNTINLGVAVGLPRLSSKIAVWRSLCQESGGPSGDHQEITIMHFPKYWRIEHHAPNAFPKYWRDSAGFGSTAGIHFFKY